jgi:hypothetical protein
MDRLTGWAGLVGDGRLIEWTLTRFPYTLTRPRPQLDPAIKRDPWTPEEEEILQQAHATLGNKCVGVPCRVSVCVCVCLCVDDEVRGVFDHVEAEPHI